MGSDLGGARARRRQAPSCKSVLWVGVLPFCLGLLVILLFFRHQPLPIGLSQRGIVHREALEIACEGKIPREACNCPSVAGSQDLSKLKGALTKDSVDRVLGAANSSDPAEQTVRVNADALPSTFLFVGVLSGRGYRCRALFSLWHSCSALARNDVRASSFLSPQDMSILLTP